MLLAFAANTSAQTNPPMAGQQRDNEKDTLYALYSDYKRNPDPKQQRFAYPTAKEYLRKFGGDDDQYAREVQKFVTEYERKLHNDELYLAYTQKNYVKAFELGRPLLRTEPENFFALVVMTEAGYENALAGDSKLNAETIDYARRAIQLLEAGKVAKADPLKDMDMARGFLNSALGWFIRDQSPVEAAAAFRKSAQSDSPFRNDPMTYYRLGIAILNGEFARFSAEYNEKYGNKPPSAEQQTLLQRIQKLAEQTIDAYARAVALSSSPQQQEAHNKILTQLTALYKNFHNNSDAGLNELISTVLSKPLP